MIDPLPPGDLILETDRLRLTPMMPEDIDVVLRLFTDERVMRYVADVETPETMRAHMTDAVKRGAGGRIGIWCITRKDTGTKIGDCILLPVPIEQDDYDWTDIVPDRYPNGQIEVGYLLIPEAWGQGFATEVCARLLRFAFENTDLEEIVATTDPENAKSQHVLQKCGLVSIGKKRAYAWDDVSWFHISKADWSANASNSE